MVSKLQKMNYLKIIALVLCIITQIHGASKYNKDDEDHPYEFGFTIDQQQHRHESKDVNGIIQGEFGFITADGIYHTTVYATDENGNFKILSMRNVRVSPPLDQLDAKIDSFQKKQTATPPPTAPTARPQRTTSSPPVQPQLQPQYHPQPHPQSNPQPQNQPYQPPNQPNHSPNQLNHTPNQPANQPQFPSVATTRRPHPVFTTQRTEKPACAGCGYVTTPKPIPGQPQKLPFFQLSFDNPGSQIIGPKPVQSNPPTTVQQGQITGQYPVQNNPSSTAQGQNPVHRNPSTTSQGHTGSIPLLGAPHNGLIAPPHSATGVNYNPNQGHPNQPNTQQLNGPSTTFNQPSPQVPPSFGNPDGSIPPFNPNPAVGIANIPSIPITDNTHDIGRPIRDDIKVTDGFIKVPNNEPIKIKDKYPGMVDGLPPGVTQNDITDLLYRFNYTVGFHGHYEKGYKNGAKVGGYFVNDRDGVSRIVTYVADENGYRPKVKFIRLNLDSDDVPKEGSEKKFGLKNFEFVWYPIK